MMLIMSCNPFRFEYSSKPAAGTLTLKDTRASMQSVRMIDLGTIALAQQHDTTPTAWATTSTTICWRGSLVTSSQATGPI
jgi:hypothetical protein